MMAELVLLGHHLYGLTNDNITWFEGGNELSIAGRVAGIGVSADRRQMET